MLSNKLPALARAVLRAVPVPVRAQVVLVPEQVLQALVPQVQVQVQPPQVLQLQLV